MNNGKDGLYLKSAGVITISRFTSSWNTGMGINIESAKSVLLYTSRTEENRGDGVSIIALDKVVVNTLNSFTNGYDTLS